MSGEDPRSPLMALPGLGLAMARPRAPGRRAAGWARWPVCVQRLLPAVPVQGAAAQTQAAGQLQQQEPVHPCDAGGRGRLGAVGR